MMDMWIESDLIPALIDAVGIKIKEEMDIQEDSASRPDENFDRNDLIIFHSFVLPVLKENKEKGFSSEQMLKKGFSFMVSLIPYYLKNYRERIKRDLYGKLAKIYYNHSLNNASLYLNSIENEYIEENIENINKYIDLSKIK
jgi:hypothetical protein